MRSVRRSERFENMIRLLAVDNHPLAGRPIFPTMRELLCFAAMLGFQVERKYPVDDKTEEIDGRTFENHQRSHDLICLLALADSKDAEVLREENEEQCVTIFEQYAEGGLRELDSWLNEMPADEYGDNAILMSLLNKGYLGSTSTIEEAIHDISFGE